MFSLAKKKAGAQFSKDSHATLNMRVLGDGSCSAQEDGEEEEAEKGGGNGTGNRQENHLNYRQTGIIQGGRRRGGIARQGKHRL